MSRFDPIIDLHPWLGLAPGQALLDWEQDQLDRLVADVFGFHALQLGLPELDALRANRMQHRWLALDAAYQGWGASRASPSEKAATSLHCDFESLPFPNNSLDLVVLPHALELARDPHHTLREVERVLMPEGRVVIAGFNPASLWGMWQRMGRLGIKSALVLPQGEFIAYWRLRDWLRLLDLEIETGCFGCFRPMLRSEQQFQRLRWMEAAGERWWPVLGAVYFVVAVKRARGMRLVGKLKRPRLSPAAAPAVVAQSQQHR
jgi:SAM-dependent methyltransferase